MVPFDPSDLLALMPSLILSAGAIVVLLSEVFLVSNRRHYQPGICGVTAIAAAMSALNLLGQPAHPIFGGMGASDGFGAIIALTVCLGLLLSTLTAASFLHQHHVERGEYYALTLFAAAGMSLLALSTDLLTIFISLEVMSVAVYALTAYIRRGRRPAEAAFKYFLLGAFASALYIYGAALVYGATGSTLLRDVAAHSHGGLLLGAGMSFIIAGFAFKVAAVPFHMWAPDVYEGAPTPVTSFMAVGVKAAAFAVVFRTLVVAFPAAAVGQMTSWAGIIALLAVLTMVFGNLLAVQQRNVKRMLAYSSVAHAGYLLLGVAAAGRSQVVSAGTGVIFYLVAYTAAAAGAFGVVAGLEKEAPDALAAWDLDRFAGLSSRRPVLALICAVFMTSLAGIPPTAGFMGKLFIFRSAVDAGMTVPAVIGVLSSVIGAYYYLRVVIYMFMRPPEPTVALPAPGLALNAGLWLAAAAVIILGIGPSTVLEMARQSAQTLVG